MHSTGTSRSPPGNTTSTASADRSRLLRPITHTAAQECIRDLVLEAFAEYEQELARTA